MADSIKTNTNEVDKETTTEPQTPEKDTQDTDMEEYNQASDEGERGNSEEDPALIDDEVNETENGGTDTDQGSIAQNNDKYTEGQNNDRYTEGQNEEPIEEPREEPIEEPIEVQSEEQTEEQTEDQNDELVEHHEQKKTRNLRARSRGLDYKALSTGRMETSKTTKKKKGKNTNPQGKKGKASTTKKGQQQKAKREESGAEEKASASGKKENPGAEDKASASGSREGPGAEEKASASGHHTPGPQRTKEGINHQEKEEKNEKKEKQNEKKKPTHTVQCKRSIENQTKTGKTNKKRRTEEKNSSSSSSDSSSSSSSEDSSSTSESSHTEMLQKRWKKKKESKRPKKMEALKKENNELREEISRTREKASERRDTIRKKDNTIRKIEEEANDQRKKYIEERKERQNLENKVVELQQENKKLQERLNRTESVKEDFKNQKIEANRKIENLERQLTETRRKIKECEQLNDELLDKITTERGKQREEQTEQKLKQETDFKGIIVGDSNSRRIAPHFKRENTWDITENTYVTKDAERIRCERTYDVAIFMLGTNDIKIGKDGKKEAEYLLETVEKSKIARMKFIIELPPINRKGRETERRLFNRTLHKQNTNKEVRIIRMVPEIEETPIEQALQDDLHLNNSNANQMAKQIELIVEKTINTERGDRRRKSNYPKETREEAGTSRNHEEQREEWKNIPCRYHIQGRCYRGEFCYFKHDQVSRNTRPNEENKERNSRDETRQRNPRDQSRDRCEKWRNDERTPRSGDRRNEDSHRSHRSPRNKDRRTSQSGESRSPRNKDRRTSQSGERRYENRDRSLSRDRRTVIDIRSVRRTQKNE